MHTDVRVLKGLSLSFSLGFWCALPISDGEALSEVDRVEKSRPLPPRPPLLPEVKSVEELNVLTDGGDSDCCLQCFNVPLKYGVNEYNLTAQVGFFIHCWNQGEVVQLADNSIQRMGRYPGDKRSHTRCATHWIEIYPVDSVVRFSNN